MHCGAEVTESSTNKQHHLFIPELAEASEALAKDHIQTGVLILQNVKTRKVNMSDECGAYHWGAYDKAWDLLQLAHEHAEEFECFYEKLERGTGNGTLESDETEKRVLS